MTLQEQIINTLLQSKRDFYIHEAYIGYGNFGQTGKLYHVDCNKQKNYNGNQLLAEPNEDYRPSMSLVANDDIYGHLFGKTSFSSEEEKNSEIKRILEASGFKNRMNNRVKMEEEIGDYLDKLESKKQAEIILKANGGLVEIPLEKIYHIGISIENELHTIWHQRDDEDRLSIERFKLTCSDDDFIQRYSLDNPATLEEHIKNTIAAVGKDVFLNNIIDDNDYRVSLIEKFLEDEDIYSLLQSIYTHVNSQLVKGLERDLLGEHRTISFLNQFSVPYDKIKNIHARARSGYPCIKAQTRKHPNGIINVNSWAAAMMNTGLKVHVNAQSVYRKSKEEVLEIVKPMAIEHFNKRKILTDGIISYRFYDLFEHYFEISLDELGLEVLATTKENSDD
ncbi:hypothetical protein GJV85_08790 [Sulfurimonas aquatica]|uniref:Uncharacterized protein n=1 Tax=Sulfurimonas aquatica TaxID=2672570 RepID=A0A975GDD5_9BACT|nr:hypothetical protein [Sulfurimonas aquatica]QSZ42204.1 hypothetical protein GJV85_08790 [Sulfurimonas aquatica]